MSIATKIIKGIEYVYYTERDVAAKKTRFHYCGPAHETYAQLRAARLERARLDREITTLTAAADELSTRIRRLEAGEPKSGEPAGGPKR